MNDAIFSIAHYADQAVLLLLVVLAMVAMWLILFKSVQFLQAKKSMRGVEIFSSSLISRDWSGQVPEQLQREKVGPLLVGTLEHLYERGDRGLDEVFSVLKSRFLAPYEASLAFLATVGSNAPYIGLFGTVLGIMKAFHDMASAQEGASNSVMSGISAALIATAAGLLVAIPSVLAYNYFQKRLKKMNVCLDQAKDLLKVSYSEVERGS